MSQQDGTANVDPAACTDCLHEYKQSPCRFSNAYLADIYKEEIRNLQQVPVCFECHHRIGVHAPPLAYHAKHQTDQLKSPDVTVTPGGGLSRKASFATSGGSTYTTTTADRTSSGGATALQDGAGCAFVSQISTRKPATPVPTPAVGCDDYEPPHEILDFQIHPRFYVMVLFSSEQVKKDDQEPPTEPDAINIGNLEAVAEVLIKDAEKEHTVTPGPPKDDGVHFDGCEDGLDPPVVHLLRDLSSILDTVRNKEDVAKWLRASEHWAAQEFVERVARDDDPEAARHNQDDVMLNDEKKRKPRMKHRHIRRALAGEIYSNWIKHQATSRRHECEWNHQPPAPIQAPIAELVANISRDDPTPLPPTKQFEPVPENECRKQKHQMELADIVNISFCQQRMKFKRGMSFTAMSDSSAKDADGDIDIEVNKAGLIEIEMRTDMGDAWRHHSRLYLWSMLILESIKCLRSRPEIQGAYLVDFENNPYLSTTALDALVHPYRPCPSTHLKDTHLKEWLNSKDRCETCRSDASSSVSSEPHGSSTRTASSNASSSSMSRASTAPHTSVAPTAHSPASVASSPTTGRDLLTTSNDDGINEETIRAAARKIGYHKYPNLTYQEILERDPGYCDSVCRSTDLEGRMLDFKNWLMSLCDCVPRSLARGGADPDWETLWSDQYLIHEANAKTIGVWVEFYAGGYSNYSYKLWMDRIQHNLTNRVSEFQFIRKNSCFFFLCKEKPQASGAQPGVLHQKREFVAQFWKYMKRNFVMTTLQMKAMQFICSHLHVRMQKVIMEVNKIEDATKAKEARQTGLLGPHRRRRLLESDLKQMTALGHRVAQCRDTVTEVSSSMLQFQLVNRRPHSASVCDAAEALFPYSTLGNVIDGRIGALMERIDKKKGDIKELRDKENTNVLVGVRDITIMSGFFNFIFHRDLHARAREFWKSGQIIPGFGVQNSHRLLLVLLVLIFVILHNWGSAIFSRLLGIRAVEKLTHRLGWLGFAGLLISALWCFYKVTTHVCDLPGDVIYWLPGCEGHTHDTEFFNGLKHPDTFFFTISLVVALAWIRFRNCEHE